MASTVAVGDKITASRWNADLVDGLADLAGPPRVSLALSGDTAIANATVTLLSWATEHYDTAELHDPANPSRITVPTTGLWQLQLQVGWTGNATGYRYANVRSNAGGSPSGGVDIAQATAAAASTSPSACTIVRDLQLTAGDYLQVFASQGSGGTLSVLGAASRTWVQLRRVAA